ncbi:MAG: GTP-binding protein [Syntrophaceae bacterium]|nr:GTP-binding protein [Syntrophaceae bacterium]
MLNANIYIIGGFLGAGKTTLLQRILNWDIDLSSTAVLVNEFGQISVDGMLLDSKGTRLIELTSGCICCSMGGEFLKSLNEVLNKYIPTRIFVETTGVADTLDIIALLMDSDVLDKAILKNIVCVLDADFWQEKDNFGIVFFNQVKAADLIILNKIDLVDTDLIPLFIEEIRQINPRAMIAPTCQCEIDPDILLERDETELSHLLDNVNLLTKSELGDEKRPEFMTFTFLDEGFLSEARFTAFIEKIPSNVFRIKGIVRFPGGKVALNHVGGRSQWTEIKCSEGTELVFVGWRMDTDAILRDLDACREAV